MVGVSTTGVVGLSATDMAVAEFVLLLLSLKVRRRVVFFRGVTVAAVQTDGSHWTHSA